MTRREKGGFWVGLAATVFYPLTAIGKRAYLGAEKIPRHGPAVLVMNHISHLDPVVDAVFVHRQKRVPRFFLKDSLKKVPVFGRIVTGSGQIPVSRGSSAAGDSLKHAHEALAEGKVIVIYPEGTITKDPAGWPKKSYTGAARLALQNDVPVIPVARWGTNQIFNGYTKKFTPFPRKRITHLVGDPLDLSAYDGANPRSASTLREITELMMDRVTELLAEIRQEEPPAKKPADGS
ncbi:lysophospholipid acyltransferase family protein [Amycolatopsis jiangsuensis]|uniref:1-acyl-sn-glycerol-3-phosphate acyltransferase n=1 Tax=Amycolatopsis jiangsuensis TaxID=1181879 RepID=A0A840IS94_9PSEU|nr:lysophospholipid acyltransferase family protein [Amycolatopsis jiangsuensis]MBB4685481.1 1-acyl-sn-glycerol-3-phosphate acyltransferase [Amycolatopsis jiangsuensis]